MINLSRDEIVRLRLRSQWMSTPQPVSPTDVVRRLCAVQAQDFTATKWGIGLRIQTVDDVVVEQAFTNGEFLRTHLMRPTWHFVAPEDIRWLLALTSDRVRIMMGAMCRQLELDAEMVHRCARTIESVLKGGCQLTRNELRSAMEADGIDVGSGLRLANLMILLELDGVVCSGPRRGKQFTYMLLEERVPMAKRVERAVALAELAGRFFTSRGPATVHDFAKWSGLTIGDARNGLDAVKDRLIEVSWDGKALWMANPGGTNLTGTSPSGSDDLTAHLISVFDEYISGYQDRSAMFATGYGEILVGMGNGLLNIILISGQVVGGWRRLEQKRVLTFELDLFRPLNTAEQAAVHTAAERHAAFFGKQAALDVKAVL